MRSRADSDKVTRAFDAAVAARDRGGRGADLLGLCGGDRDVAAEVGSLLRDLEAAGTTAGRPGGEAAAMASFLDPSLLDGTREAAGRPPHGPGMLHAWGASAVGQRVGDFTLIEPLGAGGMGVVFVAEQGRPRRTVALKLIRRDAATPPMVRRFEREAHLLGRLNHPGIAQVYAAGVAQLTGLDGRPVPVPYIAMELVEGPTLRDYARRRADLKAALALVADACDAVQHAHQRGVIHRDLKPANLLVATDSAGRPRVKVLDFGVARETLGGGPDSDGAADPDRGSAGDDGGGPAGGRWQSPPPHVPLTAAGHVVGTLAYMSPEQFGAGDAVDTRCDVYALGVVLFQLLADRLPVDVAGCDLTEAGRRAAAVPPPPLGTLDRAFRGDVEAIVARALEKDPARRYQSPADLARDLRRHLAGEPIEARRESLGYTLGRRVARYRAAAAVLLGLLVTAGGFAGYAWWQERRATGAEGVASSARRQADDAAARLAAELSASRVEQGRLLAATELAAAERLLWDALLSDPAAAGPRWGLRELYGRTGCVRTFAANRRECRAIALVRRGTAVAAAGDGPTVNVFSLTDGSRLASFDTGLAHVRALAAAGAATARVETIVAGGDGGTCAIDLATGARRPLGPPGLHTDAVDVSPDGSTAAVCGDDLFVRLVDLPSGRELALLSRDGPAAAASGPASRPAAAPVGLARSTGVRGVAFAPTGDRLAAVYADGAVRLWQVALAPGRASATPGPAVDGHPGALACGVAFSPDGTLLATGATDRLLKLWRVADGSLALRIPTQNGTARTAAFSPDGCRVAVPGYWRTKIFNTQTGELADADGGRAVVGDGGSWYAAKFTPDGNRLVVGGDDGTCRVWEVEAADGPSQLLWTGTAGVRDVAAAEADGEIVVAAVDAEGTLMVRTCEGWAAAGADGEEPEACHERARVDLGGRPRGVVMTADASVVVVSREDGHLLTVLGSTGRLTQDLAAHPGPINALHLSADGRTLVTGGAEGVARVWHRRDRPRPAGAAPGGRAPRPRKASGAGETSDAGEPGWVAGPELACGGEVIGVAVRPAGDAVATSSRPTSIRLWSLSDGRLLGETADAKTPWKLAFSPDGTRLAAGAWGRTIRVWPVLPGSPAGGVLPPEPLVSLTGHAQLITAEAFDPAGGLLASVSNDGALRLWDLGGTAAPGTAGTAEDRRRCLATFDARAGEASGLSFVRPGGGAGARKATADCSRLVVGYADGSVRLWSSARLDRYVQGQIDYQQRLRRRGAAKSTVSVGS